MNIYDEVLEPTYNETVSREQYDELLEELKESEKRILGLTDDLGETQENLKSVIETIIEYGNRYSFDEAYPKLIEYLKGEKLI